MTVKDITVFLKKAPLFSGVSLKGLALIAQNVHELSFIKGAPVFHEGEKGSALYIVKSGLVKVTKASKAGKEKTLAILRPGDSFGEMAILTSEGRSATVEALADTVVYTLTKDRFTDLLSKEPSISIQIIKTLSERLARADRHIKSLALGDARERVADVLLDFYSEIGEIKFTHQEIADIAGLTRETTTRVLTQMEKDAIISTDRRKITVKDMGKLKAITG